MKKGANDATNKRLANILQDFQRWSEDMGGYDIDITLSTGYNNVDIIIEGSGKKSSIATDDNGYKRNFPKTANGCVRAAKSINQSVRDNNLAGEMDA